MLFIRSSNGIFVSKALILVTVSVCVCILLLVGLLCGFLARKTCPQTLQTTTVHSTVSDFPTTSTLSKTTTPPLDLTTLRLPTDIVPLNYNLNIKAFFDPILNDSRVDERFEGVVIITIRVINSTRLIVFHCNPSIKILDSIEITNLDTNQTIGIRTDQHYYDENEFYKIELDYPLGLGDYDLKLEYRGDFGSESNFVGFFKGAYQEDGMIKQVLATDFEPLNARKAFPCFDEPSFKSTFEISIEHPIGTIAFSNWPESPRELLTGNRYRTVFGKTYPMTTYLVAWVIVPEDFGIVRTWSQNGKEIRILARKSAVENGFLDFAAEVAKRAMDFFENVYFDPSLPALPPKIDHIAIPDFSTTAMEHWGLVGYQEKTLFYSESESSESSKQYTAVMIAHELAHFWFGNLITCKWWNEIWINEALAEFLQIKAIDTLYPSWDLDNQFITDYQIPVMFDDSIQTIVPIENPVYTSAQIGTIFNSITYEKGASVMRMIEATVGETNFQQALNVFLKENLFSSADPTAFYNALSLPSEMDGVTAKEYIETWIKQTNYPKVSISLGTNEKNNSKVLFNQKRFLISQETLPDIDFPSPFGFMWMIYLRCQAGGIYPDSHSSGDIREFSFFLRSENGEIDLERRFTWVKCNTDFKGYYTIHYSDDIDINFIQAFNIFSVGDVSNIIHDVFTMCYVDENKSYSAVSSLAGHMEYNEDNLVAWKTFTWHISKIARILEHRGAFHELKDFGIAISRPISDRINIWDNSGSHIERLLKSTLIEFLCRMQDEICLRKASDVFMSLNPFYFLFPNELTNSISPYIRDIVYKYHIQNTYNYQDFLGMNSLYGLTTNSQERNLALTAMSHSRLIWILDAILDSLIKPNVSLHPIGSQDFFSIINLIGRNPTGRYIAWWFVRSRWVAIQDIVGYQSRGLANTVKSICETFENSFLLDEMNRFFDSTNPGAGSSQRQQALEIVLHNIFWVENKEQDIVKNLFEPRKRLRIEQ